MTFFCKWTGSVPEIPLVGGGEGGASSSEAVNAMIMQMLKSQKK